MKPNRFLSAGLLTTVLVACGTGNEPPLPYAADLQDVLDRTRQAAQVMGVSAAIVVPDYGPWVGVSGESYPGRPVTPDMLFDMGSAGKLVMAALVLDLCEDGLLSLDDPVSKYLPPYPNVDGSITIRQLVTHTSGLYDLVSHPGGPFRVPYDSIDFAKWWSIEEIFTTLGGEPYFASGAGFHYTQAGYQLATLIVEQVTGSTVAVEIQRRLLDPLGLDGMLLDFSQPVPTRFEIAHPWVDPDGDGTPDDVFARSRNWIASLSRILFYTRAEDFAVWTHALFDGEVLQAASLDTMLAMVHPTPAELGSPLLVDYGLGVMDLNPQILRGERTLGHLGSIPGYRAFVGHFVDRGVTMVVLYNSDTDEGFAIVDGLLGTVLDHLGETASGGVAREPER
jgi:D-alanyl-D-alanine carboxypeptidase